MKTKTTIPFAFILLAFCLFSFPGLAKNPDLSNYFINLSEGPEGPGYADVVPEIVVSGNIVHTVWVQKISNSEANLYYRR